MRKGVLSVSSFSVNASDDRVQAISPDTDIDARGILLWLWCVLCRVLWSVVLVVCPPPSLRHPQGGWLSVFILSAVPSLKFFQAGWAGLLSGGVGASVVRLGVCCRCATA